MGSVMSLERILVACCWHFDSFGFWIDTDTFLTIASTHTFKNDNAFNRVVGAGLLKYNSSEPKNNKGSDLMSLSPAEVDPKQLRDLRIQTTAKKPAPAGQPTA